MEPSKEKFLPKVPELDLTDGPDMLTDFSREAQRHLISARNSLLVLETVPSDQEAIENVFKTFHTIKGLADFLNLKDIFSLTNEAEGLMDLTRKRVLPFEGESVVLIGKAIENLQTLLELLDEQIANGGTLKSKYIDITEVVESIRKVVSKKPAAPAQQKQAVANIPTIHFEPDMSICAQLEEKAKSGAGDVAFDRELAKHLVEDFQKTSRELKEAQSKLQERQRELIRERELAIKLTQQAQEEARAKSEYLAHMSHEIRTLINAILGFTDLLKDGTLNDKQREHLDTIILSGKMLLGIVNDILDYSKVESGKLKLEKIDFNLRHIIEEVFKIIRTRLLSKPVNLYFEVSDDVPRCLQGDPTRLKQIFINLLDNAIKFTEKGEIGITVGIADAKLSGGVKMLHCRVKDSGIGIPEDRKKRVFESYEQADSSTTRLYGGSGLGLAPCKNFIESMGGKIWIESELGKGSEFNFLIKLEEGEMPFEEIDLSALESAAGTEVMIVDSHERVVKALTDFCTKAKMKVLPVAASAKQASELLIKLQNEKKSLPAVMFIDTMMANKEGYMLGYKVRQQEQYSSIKMVAISSDVKVDSTPEFQEAGFAAFLPKPIIAGELLEMLVRLLAVKGGKKRFISPDMLSKISCEGVRILVVEDSLPNQELLKVHFEALGCTCDYASNGQEAIDFLKSNKYDLCFMDLQMPIMGGIEATTIIRNELKLKLPIIALTAAEAEEERDKCVKAGMNDYLPKPFDVDELKQKIIKSAKM